MIGTAIVLRTPKLADYSGILSNVETALRFTSNEDFLFRDPRAAQLYGSRAIEGYCMGAQVVGCYCSGTSSDGGLFQDPKCFCLETSNTGPMFRACW